MRTLTRRMAALSIVAALSLAGCSSSDGSDGGDTPNADETAATTPAPEVDAAGGDTIEGTGYTYVVPEGWAVPSQTVPGTEQTDTFAADLTDSDGFSDNVNVIRLDPAPIEDIDKLEGALVDELEGAGSKDVTTRGRADVDGEEAIHIASGQEQRGATYLTEQYNAIHDGVSYVITFSFSDSVSEADRDSLAQSVLTTWKWSS